MIMHDKKLTTKKNTSFAGHFDGYGDVRVRCQVHHLMQHVQGYLSLRSHWMPPVGKYSPHIAPVDAMVIDFWPKKTSCGVVKSLSEASVQKARNRPSTQLIEAEATSCVESRTP
jgi:hypothetical protein